MSDWCKIADNMPNRNARQCRDRWINYLSPTVVNGKWTEEEDHLLIEKYLTMGNCWRQIAAFFPTRTDINIKNRFRKLQRRMHKDIRMATGVKETAKAGQKKEEKQDDTKSGDQSHIFDDDVWTDDSVMFDSFSDLMPWT